MEENPRATAAELAQLVSGQFGRRLLGVYLFGSLAAGGFYPGRSDIDMIAVLTDEVSDVDLAALERMHDRLVAERQEWRDRIEVLYFSRAAVVSQLDEMTQIARRNEVAYVPAQQGYIVATVARALYSLATGKTTSKERAIEWLAARRPDQADWLRSTYAAYRADVRAPHERLVTFVDEASAAGTS